MFFSAAAAVAKSLQSCPTLCDPRDSSPPGSPVPGILQARTLEWVAISFSNASKWKVKVKSLSRVWLLATPWTAAHQAPPSMGLSRQQYWSGVPLSSPIFFPTSFQRQRAVFLGAWCPLPAFRSCFVEFTQRGNGLLMNLWGRKWSPHPIPPPSSLCLLKCFRWGRTRSNHKRKSSIISSQVSVRICGRNFYRGYWMFIFNRVRI